MDKLNLDKNSLRKFGITMGIAFLVITFIILFRQGQKALVISMASIIFFILAFFAPILLKPVYIFWMKLAFILSWINTRLILFIIFYFIFMPIGFALRLFKVDLLDRKIDKKKESYWRRIDKVKFNQLNYEKQF